MTITNTRTIIWFLVYEPDPKDDVENINGEETSGGGLLSLCKNIIAIFRNPVTGKWNIIFSTYTVAFLIYVALAVYLLIVLQIVTLGAPYCWSPTLIGYFGTAKLVTCGIGRLVECDL